MTGVLYRVKGEKACILGRQQLAALLLEVAMKVRYPSRVGCAYHCKPLKVRTAYPTWYGFHRRGCKQICMNVGRVVNTVGRQAFANMAVYAAFSSLT